MRRLTNPQPTPPQDIDLLAHGLDPCVAVYSKTSIVSLMFVQFSLNSHTKQGFPVKYLVLVKSEGQTSAFL